MKTWALGDVHSNFGALKEVLTLSGFDYENDKIIILGDVADGHNKLFECVEELLRIKHRVFVLGNHDKYVVNYIKDVTNRPNTWIYQGGYNSITSYSRAGGIPEPHKRFFLDEPVLYHIEDNMLFVHGGLGDSDSPQFCDEETLTWDRSMIERAKTGNIGSWRAIFCGHTSTQFITNSTKPQFLHNVVAIDTGAGGDRGRLTLMRVDGFDFKKPVYYQSGKHRATRLNGETIPELTDDEKYERY